MKRFLLIFALVLTLVACLPKRAFTFVVIPSEDPMATKAEWKPMVDYLSEGLGREVELMIVSDYSATIEAMRYKHADMARFSPAGYVMALDEGAEIEPIAVAIKQETGVAGYHALLVARAETDISDLSKLTFGFVDPGSTSGYVEPSIYLEKEGITPAEEFFAGSHNAVILAVQNGSVDVGAVASNRIAVALDEGVIESGEFKVVWQSELIPNCPIAVQSDMSKSDKETLMQLFLNMPEDIALAAATNESEYVEASDALYDPIREILHHEGK